MLMRAATLCVASVLCAGGMAASATAAGPPPPKAYKGAKVSLYAKGLNNPTSFAWGKGAMFAGDSGNSERPPTVGST